MTEPVGCLVVGLGRMGARHAQTVARSGQGALAAVADPNARRAAEVGERYGVAHYTDAEEAMDRSGARAVVIAASTDQHPALVRAAIQRGLAVFCEKPLALDLEASRRLAADVERSGVPFQLGLVRRYDPAYVEARERLARGDIGRPLMYRAVDRDPAPPPRSFLAESGGIFRDMGVHDFDAASFLMGEEVCALTAAGLATDPVFQEIGDFGEAHVAMRFASGALGSIVLGRGAAYGFDLRVEVMGETGVLTVGGAGRHGFVALAEGERRAPAYVDYWDRLEEGFRREIAAFLDGVRRGAPLTPGAAEGVRASTLAELATEAARSGQWIACPGALPRDSAGAG